MHNIIKCNKSDILVLFIQENRNLCTRVHKLISTSVHF